MKDPRDKRFFDLQKREESQLSLGEIREYMAYSEAMIEFSAYKKSRRNWIKKRDELARQLKKGE